MYKSELDMHEYMNAVEAELAVAESRRFANLERNLVLRALMRLPSSEASLERWKNFTDNPSASEISDREKWQVAETEFQPGISEFGEFFKKGKLHLQ